MPRLHLDENEEITRKEYLRRKKKQASGLKKRSKITYIMISVTVLLSIYLFTQIYVYSKSNNFKYVEGDGIKKQQVYNVYYVTEGYTYNPVYSLNSIYSNGFEDKQVYINSGLTNIQVSEKYIYGLKDGGLYRFIKETNEIEPLVEKDVIKYTLDGNRVYFIEENEKLKYLDIETKEIKDLGIDNISEVLIDNNNIFVAQDKKTKKILVKFDKEGQNRQELTNDSNVSYIIQDENNIYFVNKKDSNKIYKVGKDGQGEEKIDDVSSVSDKGTIKEIDGSKYMYISKGCLYYINVEDSNTLWKINLESKEKQKVISVAVEILENVDGTVFYKVKNEMGVYLYNDETNFMSQVTKRKLKEFFVDKTSKIENGTENTNTLNKN